MKKIFQSKHPHNRSLRNSKKIFRYNDSPEDDIGYQTSYSIKNRINPKQKFELALENLKEGFSLISSGLTGKPNYGTEYGKNLLEKSNKEDKRPIPYSAKKNNNLDNYRKKRYDFTIRKTYEPILRSVILNNSSGNTNLMKSGNKSMTLTKKRLIPRNYTEQNYEKITGYNLRYNDDSRIPIYSNFNNKDIKSKELSNMNLILQKQNKTLREHSRETGYKINDLLNNIKIIRRDNQRLNSENNKLLNKITNLENELDITKNLSMNELELKSNQISELNEEIIKLQYILEEKENEIVILNNKIKSDINQLSEFDNEELKQINNQSLLKQLKDLKNENEKLMRQIRENGKINNNSSNEGISKLIQENQKYIKLYNNLRIENDQMKNYILNIKNKKNYFELEQNEYSQKINNLLNQVNSLTVENNSLKNSINNIKQNSFIKTNKNNETELKIKINKLIEENKSLKLRLKKYTNSEQLNFLHNDLEEKNNEINDLNEKLKNLMNQFTIYKNNNSVLTKQNSKLQSDNAILNSMIAKLENEKMNYYHQIEELNKFNNQLKLQWNNINSDNPNFNKQTVQQIFDLKQKNQELEEKLSKLNNNNIQEQNELIIENSELKNENLNLKAQIEELKNINNNNPLQISKLNKLENALNSGKNIGEKNINELQLKNENQILKNEIQNLRNELSIIYKKNGNSNNYFNKMDMNDGNEKMNNNIEILNNNLNEKNKDIELLKNEIQKYKNINNKLMEENSQLKERLQLIEIDQDDGLLITLDNLKEELKDKNLQIEKLIEENNILNKRYNINNNEYERKEVEFKSNENLAGLTDAEKVKVLLDQIKELKLNSESDQIQIKALKADIKELKSKINNMQTFSGQLKDFNQFLVILNKVLENYKKKKKEQKEAFNKLVEVVNNYNI